MRVLLINHFPLEGSGSGTYTRNVAIHLAKLGHEVCIIFPENSEHFRKLTDIKLHPVFFCGNATGDSGLSFNFPCFTTHPRSTFTFYELTDSQLSSYTSAFNQAIAQEIKDFKPEIIHVQHIWILSYLVSQLALPYLVTAHGTDLMGYARSERFQKMANQAAREANRIITISEDIDALVLEYFPDCEGKTTVLKNGYDNTLFYPDSVSRKKVFDAFGWGRKTRYVVMFAGKLTEFKGVDVLIDAAQQVHQQLGGDVTTLIAGAGELEAPLKMKREQLGIKNLHFLGHQPQDALRRLFSMADVSIVPSRREPFGLVAIEALACGVPVVATAEGGLMEIIQDDVGALVPVDDPDALSKAIINELTRPDHEERKRQAAKYAREVYSQEKLIIGLVKIYREILNEVRR